MPLEASKANPSEAVRCTVVSHRLPRGRFLVWRCVLHGRVSSFFRPSESDVREFFGAAGLAGWA